MSSSKPTIKDIAKALDVSIATVSKALSGNHEIHPLTKEKVIAKAEELSYKPNIQACNLLKKHSNLIGVVVPD